MAKSGNANAQGDEIKGDLGRVRRRSKDIEHDLNSLAEAAAEWNMLAGAGRNRRNSKDYSDEALLEAFQEIDTDQSGSIEEAELETASLIVSEAQKATSRAPAPRRPRRSSACASGGGCGRARRRRAAAGGACARAAPSPLAAGGGPAP